LSLAIGLGSGPLFILHAVNHSLVKATLFLLAGNVLHLYGTKSLGKLGGLLRAAPGWAILLAAASFAAAGSPPFGTFLSEWLLLNATLTAGQIGAAVVVLLGLTITFAAVATHLGQVLFGAHPLPASGKIGLGWSAAPALLMAASLLAGFVLAPPVMAALSSLAPGGIPR
jgi:hydrogenase-4 component F